MTLPPWLGISLALLLAAYMIESRLSRICVLLNEISDTLNRAYPDPDEE